MPKDDAVYLGHMESVDSLRSEIAQLLAAKERRRQLAALPFPDKVRLVIQMQRMAAPVLRARGRCFRLWDRDAASPPTRH